jgi:hypothetical protein
MGWFRPGCREVGAWGERGHTVSVSGPLRTVEFRCPANSSGCWFRPQASARRRPAARLLAPRKAAGSAHTVPVRLPDTLGHVPCGWPRRRRRRRRPSSATHRRGSSHARAGDGFARRGTAPPAAIGPVPWPIGSVRRKRCLGGTRHRIHTEKGVSGTPQMPLTEGAPSRRSRAQHRQVGLIACSV